METFTRKHSKQQSPRKADTDKKIYINQEPVKFDNARESHYRVPNIIKDGNIVNDSGILNIIEEMVTRKLQMDQMSSDIFSCRHLAVLWGGQTKWREKGGYRGEFKQGGSEWMLLWPPR